MGSLSLLGALSLLAALGAGHAADHLVQNQPRTTSDCADLHLFLARGNNEPYPGRQSNLVEAVCDGLSSCDYEDLIYSALYTDLYCQSAYDGTIAGHTQMAAYANRCPDSKLVLGGYSQGAQIVTDILGGAGGVFFNDCVQPAIPAMSRDTAPGNMIVAALVFGNVRHAGGVSYNYGNGSEFTGYYPRSSEMLAALDDYSDVLRDWCDQGDGLCAAGAEPYSNTIHVSYFDLYSPEAGAWIKSQAGMTDDSTFKTAIPTQLSGTVQDYSTVGTAAPTGTVILDTTWTAAIAVTAKATSGTSSTSAAKSTGSSSGSSITLGPTTTATAAEVASAATSPASSSTSAAGAGPRAVNAPILAILVSAAIALASRV